MDYYKILGVDKNATQDEIKKSYRKKALEFHPDRGGDEDKFKEIAAAYEVLGDEQKKQSYDMYGTADPRMAGGQPFGSATGNPFNMRDMFNAQRRQHQQGGGGANLRAHLVISFKESYTGCTKSMKIEKPCVCESCNGKCGDGHVQCSTCHGQGMIQQQIAANFFTSSTCPHCQGVGSSIKNPCKDCKGTGTKTKESVIDIEIPAGVDDGIRIRMRGQGGAGSHGLPTGDLFVYITVNAGDNKIFQREGNRLLHTMNINYTDLYFGCEKNITLPNGASVAFKVPPKTKSDQTFRIKGKGFKNPNNSHNVGDLLVGLVLDFPELKDVEKHDKLLQEIKELEK